MVRPSFSLVALLALAACAPTNPALVPKGKASQKPVEAAATSAPVSPKGALLLQSPGTPVRVVKGVLMVETAYATDAKAGTIISSNGSAVLGMGNLITNDGGSLITNDGGSIVAQGAGNVIAPNGGTVIAPNGGTVIAPNGGTVISGNGSAIVAQGAGNYQLQAVPAAQIPAAGMLLQAVPFGGDRPLSLGTDKDGKPVYAIYTNGAGRFELYLPASESGNLHLRAVAPNGDARLVYDHVGSPAAGQELAIDEDSAQASRYLLGAFRGKMTAILEAKDIDDPAFQKEIFAGINLDAKLFDIVWGVAHTFVTRVKAAGIPETRYKEAAGRAAEALLGAVKLEDIPVDRDHTDWKGGPVDEKAIDALKAVFKLTREEVEALGTPDRIEDFFNHNNQVIYANDHLTDGHAPYRIRKHSDVGDFLVDRFFSSVHTSDTDRAGDVFFALQPKGTPLDPSTLNHLYAAATGVAVRLGFAFFQDEAAQAAVFAAIDAMGQAGAKP